MADRSERRGSVTKSLHRLEQNERGPGARRMTTAAPQNSQSATQIRDQVGRGHQSHGWFSADRRFAAQALEQQAVMGWRTRREAVARHGRNVVPHQGHATGVLARS